MNSHVSLQVACWEQAQRRCVELEAKHNCGQSPLLTEQGRGDGRRVSSIWRQAGKGCSEVCKKVKSEKSGDHFPLLPPLFSATV